jgi:hypothetical protein
MISVRTLAEGEVMPQGLGTGFEKMPVMKDFVWVAEKDGEIQGILLAAPCHGLLYLVRLCVKENCNPAIASALLRQCMRDSKERGFKGYLFHISPMLGTERRFIPICKKAGGVQVITPQVAIIGSVEEAARF